MCERFIGEYSLSDIAQETKVMRLSKHPNVLSSFACFVVKTDLWLVMPLMRKGSCLRIMRYLKSVGMGEGLKEEWIAVILKATLEGLKYFHSQNQVHRDIKAGNLLMDSDGTAVISDFGVAALVKSPGDRTSERRTFVGTPCWMAPEVMEQSEAYDEKADIWSFGITALELAKGYAPYARLNPMAVMIQTIREDPPSLKTYDTNQSMNPSSGAGSGNDGTSDRPSSQSSGKFSRHFKEIVTMCLQKNPKVRPSAATLLTRSFFTKAKDKNVLVKDLLEGVPIPDTEHMEPIRRGKLAEAVDDAKTSSKHTSSVTAQIGESGVLSDSSRRKRVTKFLDQDRAEGGQSYMPGATWEFDDETLAKMKQEVAKHTGQNEELPTNEMAGMSIDDVNAKLSGIQSRKEEGGNLMEEDHVIDFSEHLAAAGIKTEEAANNIR